MFRKIVHEGEEYPRWYGSSHYEEDGTDIVKVCYPIPFNLLSIVYQKLRRKLKFAKDRSGLGLYRAGHQQGFREGFAAGVEKIITDLNALGSSKGKTADFEPANLGSIPSPRTKKIKGKTTRK